MHDCCICDKKINKIYGKMNSIFNATYLLEMKRFQASKQKTIDYSIRITILIPTGYEYRN